MSKGHPTITVRLPRDLRNDLERLRKAEHKPLSDLVRESVRQYVAARGFRRLRGKVLPFAEAQGLLTDDDVFRALS
ncbi:MAG: ribbon-helix-helix protein, CopG family [Planctomycetes bacterium]|nr:ribbon-helix-helix protein, CopG family [Planctomycetota bacterium]